MIGTMIKRDNDQDNDRDKETVGWPTIRISNIQQGITKDQGGSEESRGVVVESMIKTTGWDSVRKAYLMNRLMIPADRPRRG